MEPSLDARLEKFEGSARRQRVISVLFERPLPMPDLISQLEPWGHRATDVAQSVRDLEFAGLVAIWGEDEQMIGLTSSGRTLSDKLAQRRAP